MLLAAAALAAASPAPAQNTYQQTVRAELMRRSAGARQAGYSADRETVFGSMNDDANDQKAVMLAAGGRYVIIAVCDEDCSDIDLRLWAPDGTKIHEDIETDDYPTLQFTAPLTGTYRLSVEMATCSQNPCYWGMQVYAASGGK
ncbi:MAG: hypothetical protein Q7J79_04190 [Gemmatimonadales bacterium]|nr:hypothetical protein [Gemmatimonadales bacterium]